MSSSHCAIPVPPTLPAIYGRASRPYLVCSTYATQRASAECQWAIPYDDVQKACVLAQVCSNADPREYLIKLGIRAIIQEGPTCGLAALAMVAATASPTVDDILQVAKQRQYTNHGEMFSAHNMLHLVQSVFDMIGKDYVSVRLYRGQLDSDDVRNSLRNGASIMVAYDSDFNHAPCLKNGHKAHWALLTGYLINETGKFFVFARHGKTRNLAVWTLASLSESNSNLKEYVAPQRYDEYSFQLPIDGIAGEYGLRNQCVIIEGLRDLDETRYPSTYIIEFISMLLAPFSVTTVYYLIRNNWEWPLLWLICVGISFLLISNQWLLIARVCNSVNEKEMTAIFHSTVYALWCIDACMALELSLIFLFTEFHAIN